MTEAFPLQAVRQRDARRSQWKALILLLAGLAAGLSCWNAIARNDEEALVLRFDRGLGATLETTVKPDGDYPFPLKSDLPEGLLVVSASDYAASAEPPVEVGDIITSVEGHQTRSLHDLAVVLDETKPGTAIQMQVTRHGEVFSTRVKRW